MTVTSRISSKVFACAASIALATCLASVAVPQTAQAVTANDVAQAQAMLQQASYAAEEAAQAYYEALDNHDAAVAAMNETQAQIEQTTAEIEANQERLSNRAVAMYRSGSPTLLDVALGSTSFESFATTWSILTSLNQSDADLIAETKDLRAQQQAEYEAYAAWEQQAAQDLAEAEQAKISLDAQVAQYQALYNSLSIELQQQIAAQQAALAAQQRVNYYPQPQAAAAQEAAGNQAAAAGGNAAAAAGAAAAADTSSTSTSTSNYVYNGGSSTCDTSVALSMLGSDYVYGGTTPDGFDCSGLAYYCGAPYRSSSALYANATSLVPVSEAQPGDVLWTNGHVGISLGGEEYVHASDYGIGVVEGDNASTAFQYALRF